MIAIAFALGAMFGVCVMCCCVVAGREERDLEKSDGEIQ